jgi:hypothetical protein
MAKVRDKYHWHLIILLGFIFLAWRWLWGFCWNPLDTACYEGPAAEDYNQHFYGWLAYAAGKPESVVPPMFSNWTWPAVIPLLYTDPIPLAAILFRPVYQLLLINFQYFSLLSLINMLISAFCGYLLGCRIVGSRLSGCALGVLLALAPPAIARLTGHEALSLHCLLVIPITLLMLRNSTLWIWALLTFVATGVHAYYLPLLLPFAILRTISAEMNPTIVFNEWGSRFLRQRNAPARISSDLLARLMDAGCLILAFLIGVILFGYAAGGMNPASERDQWSANMIAFFDSQGHSSIFRPLKKIEPFQWEGFSYLGIIITILVSLSLYHLLQRDSRLKGGSGATLFPSPRIYWALVLLALFFSFGLYFYLGEQKLLSLQSFAEKTHLDSIYFTFRATGRFIWPAYYSLLLWGFCTVGRSVRNHKALAVIIFVCLLETHIPTLALKNANLAQRHEAGVHWQQRARNSNPEGELSAILAESDIFYNATGDPAFQANKIKKLFPQAANPTIHTNYSPYLSRKPLRFDQMNSGNSCELAVNAIRLASEQGLQKPLLLLRNRTARTCKQLEFTRRVRLGDGISIYSAKPAGQPSLKPWAPADPADPAA